MLSHVQLSVTPWPVAHQAPLSMRFPRQEYWSELPFLPPGDLPDAVMESESLLCPALTGEMFTTAPSGKISMHMCFALKKKNLIRLYLYLFGVFRTFMVNWLLIWLIWVYHLTFYFLLIFTPLVFCSPFLIFLFSYDLIFFMLFHFFSFVGLLMIAFCFCYFNVCFMAYIFNLSQSTIKWYCTYFTYFTRTFQ